MSSLYIYLQGLRIELWYGLCTHYVRIMHELRMEYVWTKLMH